MPLRLTGHSFSVLQMTKNVDPKEIYEVKEQSKTSENSFSGTVFTKREFGFYGASNASFETRIGSLLSPNAIGRCRVAQHQNDVLRETRMSRKAQIPRTNRLANRRNPSIQTNPSSNTFFNAPIELRLGRNASRFGILCRSHFSDASHFLAPLGHLSAKHRSTTHPSRSSTFQVKQNLVILFAKRFFRFGSWMGGDRDGNPNVTHDTTRDVCIIARLAACDLYFNEIEKLMFEMSLWRTNDELRHAVDSIVDNMDVAAVTAERKRRNYHDFWTPPTKREPFRVILSDLRDKLYRTREVTSPSQFFSIYEKTDSSWIAPFAQRQRR